MGLCYNIAFIFSFEFMYPEEASICCICEVVSNKEEKEYCNKYIVRMKKASFNNTNLKNMRNTKIILYTRKEENYSPGDIILIEGRFEKAEVSRNYKGFNYRNYLKQKNIYGIVNSESILKQKHNMDIYTILGKIQYNLQSKIEYLYMEEDASFLKGILLGDTSKLSDNIKENFRDSSISHILAISGLHVTYVVFGVNLLLEKIIKNKNIKNYMLIFLLFMFLVLTGFSASCMRACIMTSMCLISFNFKRKNSFYISLFVAFFIIIVINPFNIFNIGMWLSFAGTLGIALFSKFLSGILKIKLNLAEKNKFLDKYQNINSAKDKFLDGYQNINSVKNKFLNKYQIINAEKNKNQDSINVLNKEIRVLEYSSLLVIINYIKERLLKIIINNFFVSISAQILIFPIMVYTFNTFSLTFFISNILISFFVGPILILGYTTVFISFFFLPLSKFLSIIERKLISIIFQISRLCASLPLSKIYVTTPNFIEIVIYYLLIFIIIYLVRTRKFYIIKLFLSYKFLKKEIYKILLNIKEKLYFIKQIILNVRLEKYGKAHQNKRNWLIKNVVVISLIILTITIIISIDSSLKIYFVDVGQGDCTVITTPKGKNIIIDGGEGNSEKYDAGENIVLPYLLDRKINKIDYLIVSHRG